MKVKEFIEKNQIGSALAAGFVEYLKMELESELPDKDLEERFQKFAGRRPNGKPIRGGVEHKNPNPEKLNRNRVEESKPTPPPIAQESDSKSSDKKKS